MHVWSAGVVIAIAISATPPRMVAQGQQDTLRLDLAGSISLALHNATPIQAEADTVRFSGIALLESYGRFLPRLTTTIGSYMQNGTSLLSSTALVPANAMFYSAGYQVMASVNLFNGFSDREHLHAALRDRAAAGAAFDRARQEVAFDVTQAFYQVVLDRRLAQVARAALALSRGRETQLVGQVAAGTRALPDLYRQQAQTRADESAVIDTDNRVKDDETALLRRLETDPSRPVTITDPAPDTTALPDSGLHVQSLVREALSRRADLAAANERAAASATEVRAAHGELLPRLNFDFGYAANGRFFNRELVDGASQLTTTQQPLLQQLGNQGIGLAQLTMSWDVFDRYRARLDVERASVSADRAQLSVVDLRLRVIGEVRQAIDDYRSAQQKLVATAAGVDAATKAYETVQGRYDVGFGTFVDVLSAQTTLTQARALREQALTNFALQKTVLRFMTGYAPLP